MKNRTLVQFDEKTGYVDGYVAKSDNVTLAIVIVNAEIFEVPIDELTIIKKV